MPLLEDHSPLAVSNVRRFIAFRVFFNSRFYYPVFAILFLDFGLTLSQFALLNVVWAVTIVLLEVPSGALADTWGRRNLLVAAGVLMVAEMALLCFAPLGNKRLLFAFFLINRILSGAAEAAASGADEALAYDSLKMSGDQGQWGRVLEIQMRYQSIGFIVAMSLGAAVYDPALMQTFSDWLGLSLDLTQEVTLRFPLFLTLLMSVLTLAVTWRMEEVDPDGSRACFDASICGRSTVEAFRLTFQAGRWILGHSFALVIIMSGLLLDHMIRLVMTIGSQYYRLIELPEATFGLIGSGLALLGLLIPRLARKLAGRFSPSFNLVLLLALTVTGLFGLTLFKPWWGLLPMIFLISVIYFNRFFNSHYLNLITESRQRATVLSFKGLSFNLAYGLIGLLYSLLLHRLRPGVAASRPHLEGAGLEDAVFMASVDWFPWYFILMAMLLLVWSWKRLKDRNEHRVPAG